MYRCPGGFSPQHAPMRIFALVFVATSLLACRDALISLDLLAAELPLAEQSLKSRPSARRVAALDTSLVAIPARARVGETLVLSVPVASGGCRGSDTTIVVRGALVATIVPYEQVVTSPDVTCPAVYFVERRMVRISLTQQGATRVRLISRSGSDQRLLAVERSVSVE
jgi:hypothetical protein